MFDLPAFDLSAVAASPPMVIETPAIELMRPPTEAGSFVLVTTETGFTIYRSWVNPAIWLLVFDDLRVQARTYKRLAHVLEGRSGANGSLPDEQTVTNWFRRTGADPERLRYGHDFRLDEIRSFFDRAEAQGADLNDAEAALRDALWTLGLLAAPAAGRGPPLPDTVLIALVGASAMPSSEHLTPAEYRAVLRHELSHAEFETNSAYRSYCLDFWQGLPSTVRDAIRRQFIRWHYDPHDDRRLANELQAYLWEVELGGYLDLYLRRAGTSLAALRTDFVAGVEDRGEPAARLFRLPGMREPLARGPGWDRIGFARKRTEENER